MAVSDPRCSDVVLIMSTTRPIASITGCIRPPTLDRGSWAGRRRPKAGQSRVFGALVTTASPEIPNAGRALAIKKAGSAAAVYAFRVAAKVDGVDAGRLWPLSHVLLTCDDPKTTTSTTQRNAHTRDATRTTKFPKLY